MYLIYIICFIFLVGMSALLSRFIFDVDINPTWIHKDYSEVTQEEFTITAQKIRFPTETELQELERLGDEILNRFDNIHKLSNQIKTLHYEVVNAPVCSTANKYFNSLAENFDIFKNQILEVQEQIALFEEKYTLYLELISEIPEFSVLHNKIYNEFMDNFGAKYESILTQNKAYSKDEEQLLSIYLNSQQIANGLFEEYFDLMCHIVYAEAGICPDIEQCYVANVIENRIKSSDFPDTIYDVVYAFGQYAPVESGSINKTPSSRVCQVVSDYLHGYIDTEMPDNVVYQALFEQGSDVWKHMESGHYFCYL